MAPLLVQSLLLLASFTLAQATGDVWPPGSSTTGIIVDNVESWNDLYEQLFMKGKPEVDPQLAKDMLTVMQTFENSIDLSVDHVEIDSDGQDKYRHVCHLKRVNEQLTQANQALAPRANTLITQILKMFEYENLTCLPSEMKKLFVYCNLERDDVPISSVIKHLTKMYFITCWERYRLALLGTRVLMSQDELSKAYMMADQVNSVDPELFRRVYGGSAGPDEIYWFKTIRGISNYFLNMLPHGQKLPSVKHRQAILHLEESLDIYVLQTCYQVCGPNKIQYKLAAEFFHLYGISAAPPRREADLEQWMNAIDVCCRVLQKNPVELRRLMKEHLIHMSRDSGTPSSVAVPVYRHVRGYGFSEGLIDPVDVSDWQDDEERMRLGPKRRRTN